MPLRNGDHGYGGVTKGLHWLTFALILAQFVVGYSMVHGASAAGAAADRVHDSKEECKATEDSDAAEAEEERCEEEVDRREDALDRADDVPTRLHVLLGLSILAMAVVRLVWRRVGGLPPWAEALSATERFVEAWVEKGLLLLLFVIPITGLLLVATDDDRVGLHIGAHLAFFVVVGVHIGLVLKHTVVQRDGHLSRML
jgi:cytochrome b561